MSDYFVATYLDQYDVVSMNLDRYVHSGHSGKGRTKREVREHTNRPDPSGHNRKTVQKLVNNVRKTRPFSGQA